jgi:DNA-binding response OmpR family regulator
MNPTILIIDDDEKLNLLLKDFFKDFGFTTLTATHPEGGLKIIKQKSPDIIILDIMLPGMNGFEVCKAIRKFSSIPIIMLTAKGELMDRVVGLELGADDYLSKPFEPRELVARIQSVLRRIHPVEKKQVRKFGSMTIDFNKHTVEVDEKSIDLTTNEFLVLCFLAQNPNKVLNRDQILDEMSGIECDAFNRSVDITMSRLRQKLNDDPKNPSFIKTVWGTGYIFIAEEQKDEE